jgi:hypothetical protein
MKPTQRSGSAGVPAGTPARDADGQASAGLATALADIAGAYLAGKITKADNPDLYQVVVPQLERRPARLRQRPPHRRLTPQPTRVLTAEVSSVSAVLASAKYMLVFGFV